MKKVLSVVLCLLVLVSSFTTVLFSNVSASDFDTVFDNPDNWVVYSGASGLGTTAGVTSWASVTLNTDPVTTYGGDASSLRLRSYAQYSTVKFEVKPNTEYTFSYRMLYNGTNSTDKILSQSAVTSVGGTADWGKDGCYDIYGTAGSARCDGGVWSSAVSTTAVRGNVKQWQEGGKWHQVTHSFNSGDNDEMIFALRFTVANDNNFYLDDFNLAEVYDFEDLNNWGIYDSRDNNGGFVGTPIVDGTGTTKGRGWGNITLDSAKTATGSGKAVKLYNNITLNAAMLPTLKANTKYTLTFKYLIPEGSEWGSTAKSWFIPGILKKGVAMNENVPAEYFHKGTAPDTAMGLWHEYNLTFTTDDTTDYAFSVYTTFVNGHTVYIDEIAINEAPKLTYFIQDFEDYTKSKSEYVGALSVVTPVGTSVSGTKALFYDSTVTGASSKEGDNRVILNPANSGLPTLTEIVNKGSKFRITAKYKLLEGEVKFYMQGVTDGTSAWTHLPANPISYKSTTLSAGDSWQEFSYDFTLKADADDNAAKYPTFFIGGAGKAYFDYITVSTLTANVPDVAIPDETPTVTDHEHFETLANWNSVSGSGSVPGGKNLPGYTNGNDIAASTVWYKVSENTNASYVNEGNKSIKIYGNTTYHYIMLPELKANNKYTLTFKYYADYINSNGNKVFGKIGIYNPNAEGATLLGKAGDVAMAPIAATAKVWNEVTLSFETNDNTELALLANIALGAKPADVTGNQYVAFLDAFNLTDNGTATAPEDSSFEDIANWGLYHPTAKGDYPGYSTIDGTAPAKRDWASATINTNTAFTSTGSGKSVKLYGNTVTNAVKLTGIEANKKYTLSFKYMIAKDATWGSSSKAWFMPGIVKKGVAMNDALPAEYLAKGSNPNTPASPSDGSWNTYNLEFTTDTTTDLFFTLYATFAGGFTIYLDEFAVTEGWTTPDPGPGPGEGEEPGPGEGEEPDPTPTPTDGDYDNAANWKLYHEDYAPSVNGEGVTERGWMNNTQNTNKTYTYNGGAKSVKFYGNIQYTAIKLNNLEQGKAYKIKFMYYAPTSSAVGGSSKAWVGHIGVVKGGTAMKSNAPTEYSKKGAVFAGEVGKWHEYTMLFRAETTDLYFGMGLTFSAGNTLYLDDFTVIETDEDPDVVPVVPGKEPKEEWVIDFETDATGKNATLSPRDRIEIVNAEGYDGKKSNMLHFKKGAYESATTLNYSTTFTTDTDAVFTMGVKPRKVYKLSFRVKTNSQTLPDGTTKGEWIGIYACFGKQNIVSSYQHSAKRDEWLYYEYNVTTTAEQNLLSIYVNAGEYTPDMWIDDIKLVETDFEPFLGWGSEPKDEILINFDDFYVSYDIPCASIKDAPARDGKVSKATYLKGGDYNYNVVANYSAVTQYRDPVFTVPCKPETLYEFSYYIYVPQKTGSVSYFALYYDWANTWVLRASGMTERDQWVKRSVRFTTKAGQTQLSLTFNGGKVIPDIYLDDILLKELKPGTLNLSSDASYSEAPYNVFENEKLTSKVTANKTTVIKLPVKKQFQYTFGITVESLKKSNSRIFLSFDGVNPMPISDVTAPFSVITADGVGGRFGIDFISDASGYVYLVIENDDGALKLSDPYLFNTNSISANLPMGKAEKPEVGTLSVNANKGHLEKLVVFGSTEEEALIGENPVTGSGTVLPVVLLFFTTLISCVLLLKSKKGGEQA